MVTWSLAFREEQFYLVASAVGRPAITCEAHRSRQPHCHSRCLFLFGTPATAFARVSSLKCALALLFL